MNEDKHDNSTPIFTDINDIPIIEDKNNIIVIVEEIPNLDPNKTEQSIINEESKFKVVNEGIGLMDLINKKEENINKNYINIIKEEENINKNDTNIMEKT